MQECVNKRILQWNEPQYEPGQVETLKMLFGGDTFNTNIKYQADAIVTRTPVLITTNTKVFPSTEAYRIRMVTYEWNTVLSMVTR